MLSEQKALRMYLIGDLPAFRMYLAELSRAEKANLVQLMKARRIPKPESIIRGCRHNIPVPDFQGCPYVSF